MTNRTRTWVLVGLLLSGVKAQLSRRNETSPSRWREADAQILAQPNVTGSFDIPGHDLSKALHGDEGPTWTLELTGGFDDRIMILNNDEESRMTAQSVAIAQVNLTMAAHSRVDHAVPGWSTCVYAFTVAIDYRNESNAVLAAEDETGCGDLIAPACIKDLQDWAADEGCLDGGLRYPIEHPLPASCGGSVMEEPHFIHERLWHPGKSMYMDEGGRWAVEVHIDRSINEPRDANATRQQYDRQFTKIWPILVYTQYAPLNGQRQQMSTFRCVRATQTSKGSREPDWDLRPEHISEDQGQNGGYRIAPTHVTFIVMIVLILV